MPSSSGVSVVITTYNRLDYLKQAVRSALHQTRPAREIVVCDGGSDDGSLEWLEKQGSALRVVALKGNPGPAALMNCGLESTRGEFAAFLESDDFWRPSYLEDMLRQFKTRETMLVHCDFTEIDARGRVLLRMNRFRRLSQFPRRTLNLLGKEIPVARALDGRTRLSFTVLRRKVFSRIGAFDPAFRWVCFDNDFLVRLAMDLGAEAFSWLDKDLGFWRRHKGQLSEMVDITECRRRSKMTGRELEALFDYICFDLKYPPALKMKLINRLDGEIGAAASPGAA